MPDLPMKYSIITYGCQMNKADSDLMAALLGKRGWQPAETRDEANLVVLNTCSVRERPEHKVYSVLGELRRWKLSRPEAVLAVSGCMAQHAAEHILARAPHVDVVIGTRQFHRITELAERAARGERPILEVSTDQDPSGSRCQEGEAVAAAPLRAFVPIIRGCSSFCSYCIVPHVRGPEASRPAHDIEREIQSLVSRGTREVTLLGQNVLAYGRDLAKGPTFDQLVARLESISGLWRIRFTTCHPRDVTEDLIEAIAHLSKVCEHIHLPIQAGTNRLLEEMHRGYTTEHYLGIIDRLRSRVPNIAISTDIMVGFPGETEQEFEESLHLYERIRFDSAFTFAYSPRPHTPAAERADQIPRKVRLERLGRLIERQNQITLEGNQRQVGEEAELLVDGRAHHGEGLLSGRTRTNKQVLLSAGAHLIGTLAAARLTQAQVWGFMGEIV